MTTTKKIKILQVIHHLFIGGAEDVLANIVRQIDKSKFDIEVCCIRNKGTHGIKLESEGYKIYEAKKEGEKYLPNTYKSLKEVINKSKPDIIHTHGDTAILNIAPLYIMNKMPKLLHTFHFGNYPHIPMKYFIAIFLFLRFSDRLIAVSDFQKKMIEKSFFLRKDSVEVIENGIPENPYLGDEVAIESMKQELGIADNEIVVGCIAVLSEQKGIKYLIEAVKNLLKTSKNLKLIIVGAGPLLDQLKGYAYDSGCNENIIFTGWREDAVKLLNIFDIFAQPSLWEAFSIVLLEAMAAKKAIIASDVADTRKLIIQNETGQLIKSGDVDGLEKAIKLYMEDKDLASKNANNAYVIFINNYTVDHMVKSYEEKYLDLFRGTNEVRGK